MDHVSVARAMDDLARKPVNATMATTIKSNFRFSIALINPSICTPRVIASISDYDSPVPQRQ
jgi:hypothetical protein